MSRDERIADYPIQVNSDAALPKSTLIVGGALWTVLFGLQVWHLSATLMVKEKQAEQGTSIAVISTKQDGYLRELDTLKGQVSSVNSRLQAIEDRQIRSQPR